MSFQPYPTRSGFIFSGLAVVFGALAIWLINLLVGQREPAQLFMLLVSLLIVLALAGLALYWSLVAFKLDYHLNRNGLAIQWGLGQQRIPINTIENIVSGQNMAAVFKGFTVDGLPLGWGNLADNRPLKFRASAPLAQSLLVMTTNQAYVISPRRPEAFILAWQARQELGPTQHWSTGIRRRWPFNIALLNDPLAGWLLGLSATLCLALLGYLSLNYAGLPPSLPVHFNNLGHADRIADKATLFILPAAGGLVLLFNALLGSLIYRWEKVGAYLLWSSSVVMQLCLWVAMLTITG